MTVSSVGNLSYKQWNECVTGELFKNADQKKDFDDYLDCIRHEGYIPEVYFKQTLNALKQLMEILLATKYDGFDNMSRPSPHHYEQFIYGATSKTNWWLTYEFGNHENSSFLCIKEERALDILKRFIKIRYKDQIEKIEVDRNDAIYITWKS